MHSSSRVGVELRRTVGALIFEWECWSHNRCVHSDLGKGQKTRFGPIRVFSLTLFRESPIYQERNEGVFSYRYNTINRLPCKGLGRDEQAFGGLTRRATTGLARDLLAIL